MSNLPGAISGPRVGSGANPDQWLSDYTGDTHTVQKGGMLARTNKPKAALISLVRNQELDGIVQSMTQLEYKWNHKYQYPWVFFNDEPFSEEFKVRELPLYEIWFES
jgi:alpha 1,2-mannosyltransferase